MKKQSSRSNKQAEIRWREGMLLFAGVVLSIFVHAIAIIDGFGEPDSARLATLAAEWNYTGKIHEYTYALRTSPLYIHAVKTSLRLGVPLRAIPSLMNWLNVIIGALTLIPLYLIWRRLSRPSVAGLACLFLSVTPAFWLANIYGMAHLPAFSLFITSLLFFTYGMKETIRNSVAWTAASALLAVLSVNLKADIILCFGAYLGLSICLHSVKKFHIAAALLIPIIALLSVILYAKRIIPGMPPFGNSAETWAASFPFTLQAVTDGYNRMIPVRTTGIFLFAACLLSAIYLVIRRCHLRLLVFCLLWACPLILFWSLKMGNSARHMMAAFCPLLFISALVVLDLFKSRRALWVFIAVVLLGNYFVSYEGSSISPDSRLHRLTMASRHFTFIRHTGADFFADVVDVEKKVYIGSTTIPYVEWAVFTRCKAFRLVRKEPKEYQLAYDENHTQYFQIENITGPATLGPSDEWFMFSFEPDISIRQHPKWVKYVKDNPLFQIESIE